jgi:hypothetical protein
VACGPALRDAGPVTTAAHGARRRLRTAIAAASAAVGLLALTGCMKVDMDMTLSEDDTVSGTIVMAVSNSLAETMGMEPGELWDQAGGELSQSAPEGATQEPYADDEYTGTEYTFTDAPISDISGEGGEDLSIAREGDEYVVTGAMNLSEGADQVESLPQEVQDAFDVQLSITFPGTVSEASGEIEGNTVTWTPQVGENTEISARGSAVAGSSFPWWVVGLAVGLVVIALVVWFVVRNNRRPAAVTGTAAGDATFAAQAAPGSVPAAGPTPEEQVFGAPPAGPTTGPVAEPLEPGRPGEEETLRRDPAEDAAPPAEAGPATDPEPGDQGRPSGPTQGA